MALNTPKHMLDKVKRTRDMYYVNVDGIQKYRAILSGSLYIGFLNPKPNKPWQTDGVLTFTNEELAHVMSDGRIVPLHGTKYAPQFLTRRGWENKKDFFIQNVKEVIETNPGQYGYLGINTIANYEKKVEDLIQETTRKLEGRIDLNKRYYFLMEEALQLYKPKRGWFSQKIYNVKIWMIKKLMG